MTAAGKPESKPERRDVEQAWVDFYAAYADAAALSDPELKDWRDRMTPAGYQKLRGNIDILKKDGQRQVGPVQMNPVVVLVQGRQAALSDCLDGSRTKIEDRGGKLVQKGPQKPVPFQVRLVRQGSAWLVDGIELKDTNGRCAG